MPEAESFIIGFRDEFSDSLALLYPLPRVSWHSFRHAHATLLHGTGEPIKTAQSLLGHSDLETTLNTYTHAVPDSLKTAVERVAGVLDLDGPNSTPGKTSEGFVN